MPTLPPLLEAKINVIPFGPITPGLLPSACGCWDNVTVPLNLSPTVIFPNRWQGTQSICGGKSVTLTYIIIDLGPSQSIQLHLTTDACVMAEQTLQPLGVPASLYCTQFQTLIQGDCCRPSSYDFWTDIHVYVPHGPCPTPEPTCDCTGGGGGGGGGDGGGDECRTCGPARCPITYALSSAPVRYATGELALTAGDLEADGFGVPWGHTRSFASRLSGNVSMGNGYNWQIREWPYLNLYSSGSGNVAIVMGQALEPLWFDKTGTSYVPRYGVKQTLQLDAAAERYRLVGLDGSTSEFSSVTGQFFKRSAPGGATLEVTSVAANGYSFSTVQRAYSSGGTTTTEEFLYDYDDGAEPGALLTAVTLRRKVGAGSWTNVTRATYTYYAQGESFGGVDDLKTVTTQTWDGSAWVNTGTTLYRYWLVIASGSASSSSARSSSSSSRSSSSSSSSSGASAEVAVQAPHLLKSVVNPAAYERLKADPSVTDPLTASDAIVSLYADFYYEYDSQRRVTKEAVQGASRTSLFAYAQSNFSDGYNRWKTKTTETLSDDTQNIIYANYAAQTMLKVFKSGASQWCEFFKYTSDGKVSLQAEPSAISGYDETKADLLNEVSGNYQYLKDGEGLIRTVTYHTATGWLTAEMLQKGELGTPLKLREYEYTSCSPVSSSSSSSSSSRSSSSSSSSVATFPAVPIYFLSKQTEYPSDTDQTKELITTYAYTFYSGTCAVKEKITTLPVVPTSQNGSGVAATRRGYFDQYGNLTWSMDERGFITRLKYDIPTGATTQRIDDVDTSIETDEPLGWVTPSGGGLNLVTDFESDNRGRITQVLAPSHAVDLSGVPGGGGSATTIRRAMWTVYKESSTGMENWTGQGYQKVSDSSYTLINPVSLSKMDLGGRVNEQIQATRASTSGKLSPSDSFAQSSYVRWTTTQYTDCCFAASQRVYHTIPTSGSGASGTNYDETDYGYSVMKRQNRVVTPGGTITDTVFDARGQVIKSYIGTNDDGATEDDPTGGGSDPDNNMVLVTENQFDNGLAGYDGNLTKATQYASASDTRVTSFCSDWRDRRVATDGEIDFFEVTYYDNLDRITKTERYDTIGPWPCSSSSSSSSRSSGSTLGNMIARSETKFDDRGRIYQTIRDAVDVTTGVVGNSLTDNSWFDAAGNVIKQLPAGSSLFTKTEYDSLGRGETHYSGYDLDETTYAEASSVTDDTIMEQSEITFDNAGNAIQIVARRRYHNAAAAQTGPLQDPSTTPKARVTYMASYPDPLGRIVASADYGTNGGTTLSRPATVPARSDNVLVSTTSYNSKGEAELATDPAGMVTFVENDDAGREIERIANFRSVSPSSSSSSSSSGGCGPSADTNVTTRTSYTPEGNVASITAVNSATGDQVTNYTYGTTLAESDIATSNLKRYETYPDSVGGADRAAFTYNRQRQVKSVTDQNGTVHAFDFDKLGRATQDRITTLGSGVDGAVRRLATSYEVRGMRAQLTSYDNATVGSGSIVNEVQFAYNDFGQLIADYQSHSGAVNTATTPKVQYGYANGNANTIRPTSLTYPNGRAISYDYGTAGGIPDASSRIDAIKDGGTALAQYSYLGLGKFVITDYTEPDIKWILNDLSGTNDPDTGDIYSGFDRFGRVKDNRWYNYGSAADTDRINYGYDRAGNRIWRQNAVATSLSKAFDELYSYDGIHRLKDMQRGTLNAGKTGITPGTSTFAECWGLDTTGNWSNYRQDDNGDGSWDLIQNRANNTVNEITNITESAGPSWITPAYDAAGNMTTIPKPANPTVGYTGLYDAWNRLVAIKEGGAFVADYAYDGAKRRTVHKTYTAGALSESRHLYYTEPASWQVTEERTGTSPDSANAERQFVWGLRYIDDLVLRDRDTDGNGSLDERLNAMQDANWNVTAITDASGTVQERYSYTAYGVPTFLDASFASRGSSSYAWETLYAGYRFDTHSAILHVRSRMYIAQCGSWCRRDPIGLFSSMSLYQYASSSPLARSDPWGALDVSDVSPMLRRSNKVCGSGFEWEHNWKLSDAERDGYIIQLVCRTAAAYRCGCGCAYTDATFIAGIKDGCPMALTADPAQKGTSCAWELWLVKNGEVFFGKPPKPIKPKTNDPDETIFFRPDKNWYENACGFYSAHFRAWFSPGIPPGGWDAWPIEPGQPTGDLPSRCSFPEESRILIPPQVEKSVDYRWHCCGDASDGDTGKAVIYTSPGPPAHVYPLVPSPAI